MIKPDNILNTFRYLFIFLMSYGMFYFALRYYNPIIGGIDYLSYANMIVKPFDYQATSSPFVYRQFSTFIASIFYKLNIYKDIGISFGENLTEKKIFFSAILSNFIAILFTSILTIRILDKQIGKSLIPSLFATLLLIFSFGSINYVFTGLVEGWTWFFVLAAYYAYLKKDLRLFAIILLISIFQKEIVVIAYTLFFFYRYIDTKLKKTKDNTYIKMLVISITSFVLYIIIRKVIFPTSGYENQLKVNYLISSLTSTTIKPEMILNYVASQNLILIYIASSISFCVILQKSVKEMRMFIDTKGIIISSILLTFIGLSLNIGNNLGRILLIFSPIWVIIIVTNLVELEKHYNKSNKKLS